MAKGGAIGSHQGVNEFTANPRRKFNQPWPAIEAGIRDILAVMAPPLPVTLASSDGARSLAAAHDLSFGHALIIAAALEAGCTTLLTEDMRSGRRFGALTVTNPFGAYGIATSMP